MQTLAHYTVQADTVTGEWLGEPEYVGEADRAEWYKKQDTDDRHYDTFEKDGDTCAIEVIWS